MNISCFEDIKKATNTELMHYFLTNTVKDTAKLINYSYSALTYHLRCRKIETKNIQKKKKTLCIKNFTKADWLKMLETQNWQDIAIAYNLSKTTIYKKLRQYNIKLKQLNIKYNNNKRNNKIYLYLDRKEFIRNYCLKCHLWTDRKNISYWKPDDCFKYGCMKFDKNNFLELKYNQDNDTVFYFGSVKNIKFFRRDLWQKKTPE